MTTPVIRSYGQVAYIHGTVGTPIAIEGFDAWDIDLNVEQVEAIANRIDTNNGDVLAPFVGAAFNRIGFSTYILGQESSNVPINIGALLRSASAVEAETGSSYVGITYTFNNPNTTDFVPVASSGAFDPIDLHIVKGKDTATTGQTIVADAVACEELDFVFVPGDMAYLRYVGRGTVDTSATTSTTSGQTNTANTTVAAGLPDPVNPHNLAFTLTPTGTSAFSPVVKSVTWQVRQTVAARTDLNNAHGYTTPHPVRRTCACVIRIETPGLTSFNTMTLAKARTAIAASMRYNNGGGSGQQINFDMQGYIDPSSITESVDDGLNVQEFVINCDQSASDFVVAPQGAA